MSEYQTYFRCSAHDLNTDHHQPCIFTFQALGCSDSSVQWGLEILTLESKLHLKLEHFDIQILNGHDNLMSQQTKWWKK